MLCDYLMPLFKKLLNTSWMLLHKFKKIRIIIVIMDKKEWKQIHQIGSLRQLFLVFFTDLTHVSLTADMRKLNTSLLLKGIGAKQKKEVEIPK